MISFHAISFTRATQSVVQNNTAFRVPASGTSMHFSSIPSVPENGQDVDGGGGCRMCNVIILIIMGCET